MQTVLLDFQVQVFEDLPHADHTSLKYCYVRRMKRELQSVGCMQLRGCWELLEWRRKANKNGPR